MKKSHKKLLLPAVLFLGILVLGLALSCSMESQVYGRLTLALEVPQLPASKALAKPVSSRFIHPAGATLSFKLYANNTLFIEQTIALDPVSPKPQTKTLTIENVPYNKELRAEIRVYGETTPVQGDEELLGSNDIYIGYLKSGNNKLTLGVKPYGGVEVEYKNDVETNKIILNSENNNTDIWNIKMFPKKGLYTLHVRIIDYIYLYDSEGKKYQNSFSIYGDNGEYDRVFYHPENEASTYYAYLNGTISNLSGRKFEQDILITRPDDNDNDVDMIVESENNNVSIDQNGSRLTIYNPYPFTLNPEYTFEHEEYAEDFTFDQFPKTLAPGEKKNFTVTFLSPEYNISATVTFSANNLTPFSVTLKGPVS